MVRNSWLLTVLGLGLVACGGGGGDGDGDGANTGGSSGGSSGGTTAGSSGGSGGSSGGGSGGTTAGTSGGTSGGSSGGTCPTPPVQQCTCPSGGMGIQSCMNGVFGECMCLEVDAGPERACPDGMTCQSLGMMIPGLPTAVCLSGGMLPPTCQTDADCTAAGFVDVPCMSIGGFLNLCVQACTP